MSRQVIWTQKIIDEFIRLGNLTELEEKVLRTRAINEWTVTRQSIEFCVSKSTIDRTIVRLKRKYDICQKQSDILPPRRKSAVELYMDTH